MLATCTTIAAIVAANPVEPVRLQGACGELFLKAERIVTVEAQGASVRGLRLQGHIRWKGGELQAPDGMDGFASAGYAASISGDENAIYSARVTNARKGIVIRKATRTTVAYTDFIGLREDGVIVSEAVGLSLYWLRFAGSAPRPTKCTAGGAVTFGLSKRDCAGLWEDGNHADAIQMRNGVTDATISHVTVSGETQGITQMDTAGDAPLAKVTIRDSVVQTSKPHPITLSECLDCRIERNVVLRSPGSERRAVIHPGKAVRCGNVVQDEAPDSPC